MTEFYKQNQRDRGPCSVVFTPPGEIHANAFHQVGGRCFLVELSAEWIDRLATAGARLETTLEGTRGELTQAATRLYKEFRYVDTISPLAVEGLALEVLASFARKSEKAPIACLPAWLREARDLLHDRFAETLTLDHIAGAVGIHPVHLSRTFNKRYRCSVGEYQRRLRVEHASRQLTATNLAIADIALATGFADQAHFSRVFRGQTGCTPAAFRRTFGLR